MCIQSHLWCKKISVYSDPGDAVSVAVVWKRPTLYFVVFHYQHISEEAIESLALLMCCASQPDQCCFFALMIEGNTPPPTHTHTPNFLSLPKWVILASGKIVNQTGSFIQTLRHCSIFFLFSISSVRSGVIVLLYGERENCLWKAANKIWVHTRWSVKCNCGHWLILIARW